VIAVDEDKESEGKAPPGFASPIEVGKVEEEEEGVWLCRDDDAKGSLARAGDGAVEEESDAA